MASYGELFDDDPYAPSAVVDASGGLSLRHLLAPAAAIIPGRSQLADWRIASTQRIGIVPQQ